MFLAHRDYCVLVLLMPRLTIRPVDDLLWDRKITMSRYKREPISALTLAVVLGLGFAGAGTGIASLITSQNQFNQLTHAIDRDVKELEEGLKYLIETVGSLAEVVQQNCRGLDLAFLKEGGICAALKEECCFFKDKLGLVRDSLKRVEQSLAETKKILDQSESWYKNWFSTSPWMSTLLPSLLGPFFGFMLLISFGPWAFRRLIGFVKSQVDEATKHSVGIHYQQLQQREPLSPESNNMEGEASHELDFEELEQLAKRRTSFLPWLWKCQRRD